VTWSNQVKAWLTKSKTPKSNNNSKTGETGKCGGPWEKSRAKIAELEKDNKSLRAQVKQLKSTGAKQSLTNSNATDVEPIKVEVQFWKQKYERATGDRVLLENQRDQETCKLAGAKLDMESLKRQHARDISHSSELAEQKEKMADMAGYIRGLKEGAMNTSNSHSNTPASGVLSLIS